MMKQSFSSAYVTSKYDDNSINTPILLPTSLGTNSTPIKEALVSKHYVNTILAKWFFRKFDGSFGVELMHKCGLYYAPDREVLAAYASRGALAELRTLERSSSIIVILLMNSVT